MAVQDSVFERIEKKYILDRAQYDGFLARIAPYMQEDAYGEQTLMTVYYDTERYDLIRRSIDKPVYKEKLRVRSYGYPAGGNVFIELKKKYRGVVYKRRERLRIDEAEAFLEGRTDPDDHSQILREIRYFLDLYQAKPKMMILYERTAYESCCGESIRLTLDRDIRYRETDLNFHSGTSGIPYADEEMFILELKVDGAMPLWLSGALSELKIYPHRFSKYGACYTKKVLGGMKKCLNPFYRAQT